MEIMSMIVSTLASKAIRVVLFRDSQRVLDEVGIGDRHFEGAKMALRNCEVSSSPERELRQAIVHLTDAYNFYQAKIDVMIEFISPVGWANGSIVCPRETRKKTLQWNFRPQQLHPRS